MRGKILPLLVIFICLVIGLSAARSAKSTDISGSRNSKSPAKFRLQSDIPWKPMYEGDPLRIRIALSIEAPRNTSADEKNQSALRIPDGWEKQVVFSLYKVFPNGDRTAYLEGVKAEPYLTIPKVNIIVTGQVVKMQWKDMIIAPNKVKLTKGRYLLRVSWKGTGLAEASSLPTGGILKAADTTFAVKKITDQPGRLAHAQRLAWLSYQTGDEKTALKYGQQALEEGVWDSSLAQIETYIIVARAASRLGDTNTANDVYAKLLDILPPGYESLEAEIYGILNPGPQNITEQPL